MNNFSTHKIVHYEDSTEFLDADEQTTRSLKETFNNEITVMRLIRSGDIKQLEEFMRNCESDIVLGYSKMRLGNERAFAQRVLTISSIAATDGGVDCTTVYALIFKYQNLIESSNDFKQLLSMSYYIMCDFCKTVSFQYYKKCKSPVLLPVLRYIHSNLNSKITVNRVAGKLNMNANYLSQLFKKEIDETFSGYVNRTKIAHAKHLMETTDKSIADISEYLAYSSPSHFNNAFKKITGTTPKQYLSEVKKI